MHYMLLFNETAAELGKRTDPARADAYWGGWTAYMQAIAQSGAMVSGNGLQPPEVSTTIRVENGKRHVVDGPFADTRKFSAATSFSTFQTSTLRSNGRRVRHASRRVRGDPSGDAASRRLMDGERRAAAPRSGGAARSSYGKLVAILASRTRDIAAAEDALADAFAAALAQWPRDGVPANPVGWLMTVARRSVGHAEGRRRTAAAAENVLRMLDEERDEVRPDSFGDDRLALMFVCAHPAIDSEAQAPLMLQTVLGLDAERIAASFLVSGATMSQRLVRAKRKIRDAGIAFSVPDPGEAPARIDSVLSAIYAAYGTAWEDVTGADSKLRNLAAEAIWLARLLRQLLPEDPEAMGLLSLMLHCQARSAARRSAEGAFVPLHDQDMTLWSRSMIEEAETTCGPLRAWPHRAGSRPKPQSSRFMPTSA